MTGSAFNVTLDAVIVAVTDDAPRLLTVGGSLPAGDFDPTGDPTLQLGLRRVIADQAGIEVGYVEQLYTFGDAARDAGPRHLSIAYLALVKEVAPQPTAEWLALYELFPWEDRRTDPAAVMDGIEPWLSAWAAGGTDPAARHERVAIAFGTGGLPWDGIRVLDRYELLYEAGAVAEAYVDRGEVPPPDLPPSRSLGGDARRVAATGLGRLRGKITYRPVVFELTAETFTLSQLQAVVEALAGERLHKQNFRRLVETTGLVEGTGTFDSDTGGRPAERFRFRREVLLERPRPGLGHPSRG